MTTTLGGPHRFLLFLFPIYCETRGDLDEVHRFILMLAFFPFLSPVSFGTSGITGLLSGHEASLIPSLVEISTGELHIHSPFMWRMSLVLARDSMEPLCFDMLRIY